MAQKDKQFKILTNKGYPFIIPRKEIKSIRSINTPRGRKVKVTVIGNLKIIGNKPQEAAA